MFVEKLLEVKVTELLPGDITAKKVYSKNGTTLVVENTKLNDALIMGLKKNFIPSVYVYRQVNLEENEEKEIDIGEIIYQEGERIADFSVTKLIKKNKEPEQIKNIILQVLRTPSILSLMTKLRSIGEYRFRNAIDVSILSVTIAKEMGFPLNRLIVICTASLLHDIGMIKIPRDILNKTEELTEAEREIIKLHPKHGFDIADETKQFNLEICKIILQHHERFDGTGYPSGLENDYIHVMAKIIGLCDVYDALINDRPHRPKFKKSETIEYLLGTGNFYFNNDIINALVNSITVYHHGQWVELSTKEVGIVIENQNEIFSIRPKVMIYFDEFGNQLDQIKEVDLSLRENVNISINKNI